MPIPFNEAGSHRETFVRLNGGAWEPFDEGVSICHRHSSLLPFVDWSVATLCIHIGNGRVNKDFPDFQKWKANEKSFIISSVKSSPWRSVVDVWSEAELCQGDILRGRLTTLLAWKRLGDWESHAKEMRMMLSFGANLICNGLGSCLGEMAVKMSLMGRF